MRKNKVCNVSSCVATTVWRQYRNYLDDYTVPSMLKKWTAQNTENLTTDMAAD